MPLSTPISGSHVGGASVDKIADARMSCKAVRRDDLLVYKNPHISPHSVCESLKVINLKLNSLNSRFEMRRRYSNCAKIFLRDLSNSHAAVRRDSEGSIMQD